MKYLLVGVQTLCGEATYNYGVFTDENTYEKALEAFKREMTEHNVKVYEPDLIKKIKFNTYFQLTGNNYCIVRKTSKGLIFYLPCTEQDRLDDGGNVPILRLILNQFVCTEEIDSI